MDIKARVECESLDEIKRSSSGSKVEGAGKAQRYRRGAG